MEASCEPGWRCAKCNVVWSRQSPQGCPDCTRLGVAVLFGRDGWMPVRETQEAPMRAVLAVYPDTPNEGMLECGHLFTHPDTKFVLEKGMETGCVACWREERVGRISSLPDRGLLMVEVLTDTA